MLLSPQIGGAETLASSLAEKWHSKGIESQIAYLDPQGYDTHSRLQRILTTRRAYQGFMPDVVLSHSALPNAYCRLALPRNAVIVPVLHSSADDYSAKLLRYLELTFRTLRNDSIVAVSETAKDRYTARFPKHPPITIIENGVSDPGFNFRANPSTPHIVTMARVASVKNPWLWTRVVSHFESMENPVHFHWMGPYDREAEIKSLVKSHNSTSALGRFIGAKENSAQYLADYDIYFHPSDREALSMSILEAVMAGLPVVASQPVADAMGPDLVAETFVAGEASSAIDALERVLANYASHVADGARRRQMVADSYGIESTASSYINLFQSITSYTRLNGH